MLPGGLAILGVFICAPVEVYDRYANKLRDVCYRFVLSLKESLFELINSVRCDYYGESASFPLSQVEATLLCLNT